jgi:antitoxin HicB
MLAYPIKLTKDDNGTYLVTCPDFPEATTFGKDMDDSCKRAVDAIEEAIAARMADREPIPRPSKGKYRVVLPAQAAAKIFLYRLMLDQDVSKNQLARFLKWHRPQVDRLLNLHHATRMDALEAALAALGARMKIQIEKNTD